MDRAEVGDEHEPLPGVDVRRRAAGLAPGQAEIAEPEPQLEVELPQAQHGNVVGAAPAEDLALDDDAAEVVCLGGPRRDELARVVDEVEHVLGLPRGQRGQQRAPPGRDQQERAPRHRPQVVHQRGDVRQVGEVVAGHGGVDLHLQAQLSGGPPGVQRPAEHPGHAAEPVVDLRGRAVQAQRDRPRAGLVQRGEAAGGQRRRARRRDRDRQPEPGPAPDQVEQVRPLERVAAGEHEHRRRRAEPGDLRHEVTRLGCRQLPGVPVRPGLGPAVHAGQRARLGHLPDDDERPHADVVPPVAYRRGRHEPRRGDAGRWPPRSADPGRRPARPSWPKGCGRPRRRAGSPP